MFNVSLYNVSVKIDIFARDEIVAKATQPNTEWMEIHVDSITGCFDILGVKQMNLDFVDDDYILFKKWKEGDHVLITISKHGIARTVGKMLEYLAGDKAVTLFDYDDND